MRRDELRAVQDPLKRGYRDDPSTARITLSADGTPDEGIACSVRNRNGDGTGRVTGPR
jgi:hypothetical protein